MKFASFSVAALDFYPKLNLSYAGGNSLNQAIRIRQAGIESAFVGALGKDDAGDRIFALLERSGVNTKGVCRFDGETAGNRILNDKHGERFGEEGAWHGGVYERHVFASKQWQFLNTYDIWATHINCPNIKETFKRKSADKKLCIDFLHLKDYAALENAADKIDIAYFGGEPGMEEALSQLAQSINTVIVLTLGAEGSIAFYKDEKFIQPALDIEKVVDTTGCGDAFQAAFTASYFKTRNIQDALLAGARQGKVAASQYGGVPW